MRMVDEMIYEGNYASDSAGAISSGSEPEQSEFVFDGERCEICMEIIVEQGVLECCNGRFCFVCIDNWATITTLCPLCQSEIQTIQCVPAYDKFGSKEVNTKLFSRDCDWDGEEKGNNAIYFPSCYIDEKAVTCLGGDECKWRGGLRSAIVGEESDLDTSIACDSCDIWYHAFCVGFDPDDTSSLTWLCPRCMVDDEQQRPAKKTLLQVENSINEDARCFVDASFPGRLSVSLAGVGETAVVVSLVDVNGPVLESTGITPLSNVSEVGLPSSPSKVSAIEEGNSLSRPYGTPSALTSNSVVVGTSNIAEETPSIPHEEGGFSPIRTFERSDRDGLNVCNSLKHESSATHPDFLLPGEDNIEQYDGTEFETIEESKGEIVFEEPSFAVENFEPLIIKQVCSKSLGVESKNESSRLPTSSSMTKEAVKKESSNLKKTLIFKDKNVVQRCVVKEKAKERNNYITDDIMSIVRGTGRRRRNLSLPKIATSGPRLKKIRRVSAEEDRCSSIIRKLRNDIREAARNCPTEDPGKNLFETKLMDAFKTAIVGPTSNGYKRESRVVGKGKNEVWKQSRAGATELEKIETLKSVLDNLRSGSGDRAGVKREKWACRDDTILSRLYLADTSVVPRKNDIKPFSDSERFRAEPVNKKEVENHPRGSLFSPRTNNIAESSKPKESNSKQITDRSDKKRWALEVLARKTGVTNGGIRTTRTVPKDDQNTALFKANYPLLSQLPHDMLPIVTPGQSCKVPTSLRQAQLYRIAENFLRKADLPSIRRTAVTELAVADAINIENSLSQTSNCRSVYLNLCSRELLRSSRKAESAVTIAPSVEAALKSAGFLSDSPPTSPDRAAEVAPAFTEPDNILETSIFDPELNIYGDFDYDLGEQDYIGSATAPTVEPQVKMKVVLSVPDSRESCEYVKLQNRTSVDPEGRGEASFHGIRASEGGEEFLKEECMELYGPDKEPPVEKDIVFMECSRIGETRNPILVEKDVVVMEGSRIGETRSPIPEEKDIVVMEGSRIGETRNPIPEEKDIVVMESSRIDETRNPIPEEKDIIVMESSRIGETRNPIPEEKDIVVMESSRIEETRNPIPEEKDITVMEGSRIGETRNPIPEENDIVVMESSRIRESRNPIPEEAGDSAGSVAEAPGPPSPCHSETAESIPAVSWKRKKVETVRKTEPQHGSSVYEKVKAYVKEHIRPLWRSGVITGDEYRRAAKKTTDKVMRYHRNDTDATFLVKEGHKVRKLAEQYVEASHHP